MFKAWVHCHNFSCENKTRTLRICFVRLLLLLEIEAEVDLRVKVHLDPKGNISGVCL